MVHVRNGLAGIQISSLTRSIYLNCMRNFDFSHSQSPVIHLQGRGHRGCVRELDQGVLDGVVRSGAIPEVLDLTGFRKEFDARLRRNGRIDADNSHSPTYFVNFVEGCAGGENWVWG